MSSFSSSRPLYFSFNNNYVLYFGQCTRPQCMILNVTVKVIQPAINASLWHTCTDGGVTSTYAGGQNSPALQCNSHFLVLSWNRFSILEICAQHLTNPHNQTVADNNGLKHAEMQLFSTGCSASPHIRKKISSVSTLPYGSWQWRIDVPGGPDAVQNVTRPYTSHPIIPYIITKDTINSQRSVINNLNCNIHFCLFHFTQITRTSPHSTEP
jgi:hypothetical protein